MENSSVNSLTNIIKSEMGVLCGATSPEAMMRPGVMPQMPDGLKQMYDDVHNQNPNLGPTEVLRKVSDQIAHSIIEDFESGDSIQEEIDDTLLIDVDLCEHVDKDYAEQIEVIHKFRGSVKRLNPIVLPKFKLEPGVSFFDFLAAEKIYSKPKLKEAILKGESSDAYETYKYKLPASVERTAKLAFLVNAGALQLAATNNPHLVFDLAIEYRLLRWGLGTLNLDVPKKLHDIDTLYKASESFEQQFLGAYASIQISENNKFFPVGLLGILEKVSIFLSNAESDDCLSDEAWNALAAILFAISAIGGTEQITAPLIVGRKVLADMLENDHAKDKLYRLLDHVFINEFAAKPLFLCYTAIIATLSETRDLNCSLRNMVNHYVDNLPLLGEAFEQVLLHPDDVMDAKAGAVNAAYSAYMEFIDTSLKDLTGYRELVSKDSLPTLTALSEEFLSIKERPNHWRNVATANLMDEFKSIIVGHNDYPLWSPEETKEDFEELAAESKSLIDYGDIEQATVVLGKLTEHKKALANDLIGHLNVTKKVSHFFDEIDNLYESQQKDKLNSVSSYELRNKELQCEIDDLTIELQHAHDKNQNLNDELFKKHQEINALEIEKQKIKSEISHGFSEELSCVLFGRPRTPTCHDVLIVMQQTYPYVEFADGALEFAKNCVYANVDNLFKMLNLVCGEYYQKIVTESRPDCEARTLLGKAYSRGESDTVMKSSKLRAMREFTYNGDKITVSKHLTIGVSRNSTQTVQVHFDIIEGNKLLIARLGEHLPTSMN